MNDRPSWPDLRDALLRQTDPHPGLEDRLLSAARVAAPARRPSWALGAAAAALAILVVATLLLAGRALQRATVPAATPPPASGQPGASGPPPAVSTLPLSSPRLDANGVGWVVERAAQAPLPGAQTLFHTADGGATWTRQLDLDAGFVDLSTGPAGHAMVYDMGMSTGTGTAATRPQAFFVSTTDGGANWQRYAPPVSGLPEAVQMADGREAWLTAAAGSGTGIPSQWAIYHTADGARTWQRVATVDLQATFGATNMGFTRSGSGRYVLFVPQIGGQPATRLYTSSDGGAHWLGSPIPGPAGQQVPAISVLPDGHLALARQGMLLVSDDGGQRWSAARPLPAGVTSATIQGLDAAHWWLAAPGGGIFASGDEGVSWTPAGALPGGMALYDLSFSSPTTAWAIASYLRPRAADVLLATADGGATWRGVTPPHRFQPAVPCGGVGATVRARARLEVTLNGQAQPNAVPAGIGAAYGCRYRLTTSAGGTVEIAATPAERGRTYTLGDLLDVWGVSDLASIAGVAGSSIRTTVRVDGRDYAGDPRAIPLRDGTRVTIAVTAPTGGG